MLIIIELLFIVMLAMILFMISRDERSLSRARLHKARVEEYWDGKERRRHVRFKKNLEVTYRVQNKPNLKNGKTIDISESGVKLLLDEKLAEGTTVVLQIFIPDSKKIEAVEGKIVWSRELKAEDSLGRRLFHSGIKFLAAKKPSSTNLASYIRSLCEDSGEEIV